jgi:type IV pilus assembly protein PilV
MNRKLPSAKPQRGFTMIEVLVSVVVLAFGLLGVAGLQLASVRGGHVSTLRSIASQAAYDIAEKMRANPVGVSANDYSRSPRKNDSCYTASGCSAQQMAETDLWVWQETLSDSKRGLPEGSGRVCRDNPTTNAACDGGASDPFVVRIQWSEQSDQKGGAVTTQTFLTYFQP